MCPVVPSTEIRSGRNSGRGLRVERVYNGSPAAEGGFVSGDILVGFHVWEMTRLEELQYALARR